MFYKGVEYIDKHKDYILRNNSNYELMSSGKVTKDIINNLLLNLSIVNYFDEHMFFFDVYSESDMYSFDPEYCSWIEIEGFDYGWLHVNYKEDVHFKQIRKALFKSIKTSLENKIINNYEYFLFKETYNNQIIFRYYFYNTDIDLIGFAQDYMISISDKELDF